MIVWYLFGLAALYGASPDLWRHFKSIHAVVPFGTVLTYGGGLAIFLFVPRLIETLLGIDAVAPSKPNAMIAVIDAFYGLPLAPFVFILVMVCICACGAQIAFGRRI